MLWVLLLSRQALSVCGGSTPFLNTLTSTCVANCPWAAPNRYYGNPATNTCEATCTSGYGLATTQQCVTSCPFTPSNSNITYKDDHYKTCDTVCPANPALFAQNSTQSCVAVCAGSNYADESTRTCVPVCPANTFTFVNGTVRYCKTTCPSGYYSTNLGTCVIATSCPANYYADTSTNTCVRNCSSSDQTWGQNTTNTCLKVCPSGSFSVDTPYRICIAVCPQLPAPALFGSTLLKRCVASCPGYTFADPLNYQCVFPCSSSTYFADSTTQSCVQKCPSGTYADSNTNTCTSFCSLGTYGDPGSQACIGTCTVASNLYADLNARLCVGQYSCPSGTFADPYSRACVQTCPSSQSFYGNSITRTCGLTCPYNVGVYMTFKDDSTRTCVTRCPTNPPLFADPNTQACVQTCPQTPTVPLNLYADTTTGRCVTICPAGYQANLTSFVCSGTCSTSSNYYNPATNTCGSTCLAPFFAQNTTRSCLTYCTVNPSTYADITLNACVATCSSGRYAQDVTRTCDLNCTQQTNTFASPSTSKCVLVCPVAGLEFAFLPNRTCVTNCGTGLFAYSTTRTCVSACPSPFFGDTTANTCVLQCSGSKFRDPTTKTCVTTCPSQPLSYFGDSALYICVLTCPSGYFRNSVSQLCVLPSGCPTNQYADPVSLNCVRVCPSNATLSYFAQSSTKVCTPACLPGTFADRVTRLCSSSCSSSQFADPSTLRCVSVCPTVPDLYAHNGQCVSSCPTSPQRFAENVTRSCVTTCPYTPIALFADTVTGRCVVSCLANTTFIHVTNTQRQCLNPCINGLFADPSVGRCVSLCNNNPSLFADSTTMTCVPICPKVGSTYYYADGRTRTCSQTCPTVSWNTFADPVSQTCLLTCPVGYFRDKSVPAAGVCVVQCISTQFADHTTGNCVTTCPSPLLAHTPTKTCVAVCPDGFFANVTAKACFSACNSGLTLWGNNYTFICVSSCPTTPALFAYNTANMCVEMCPSTPDLYANEATKTCVAPTGCQSGYFADDLARRCVSVCPSQYQRFGQNSTRKCVQTCATGYADNQTNVCVSICPAVLFTYGHLGVCLQECPTNYWKDNSTQTCVNLCPSGTMADPTSGYCVTACPYSYFGDDRAAVRMCVLTCPTTPLLYADQYSKLCVSTCPIANGSYGVVFNGQNHCMNPCPAGTFGVNSSRTCENSCAAGFADSQLRMCVTACSAVPLIFGNVATHTCVAQCPSSTYSYIDASMLCVNRCPGSYYGDPLTQICVLVCPYSYFRDSTSNMCTQTCSNSPVNQFVDPSTGNCVTTCPSTPNLFGDTGVSPFACVFNCSSGIYADNLADRLCLAQCTQASGTYLDTVKRQCVTLCPRGFFSNNARVCVTQCPVTSPQLYSDPTTRICQFPCSANYFADETAFQCLLLCPAGTFADALTNRCAAGCSGSHYADPSTRKCVSQCPALPLLYGQSSTWSCVVSCANALQYAQLSSRTCVIAATCNPQFADPTTKKCVNQCPFYAQNFADPSIWTCSPTCTSPLNADPSTMRCVSVCPAVPSLYAYSNVCQANCQGTGLFGDPVGRTCLLNCPFTSPNFLYRQNSTSFCVPLCPDGSYSDNASRYCVTNCPITTYADNSTNRCVYNCPSSPSMFADATTNVCVLLCPSGYFADPVSRSCGLSCPSNPAYFRFIPLRICTQLCPYPYGKQLSSGNCVTTCVNGMYLNITRNQCVVCQVQCTTCYAQLACTSCINGYFLSLGACAVTCSVNPPLFADPTSQSCVSACSNGYFGLSSTRSCVTACPVQFYGDNAKGLCVACPTGCLTCTGANCFTCQSGYIHSPNTLTCIKMCSANAIYYYQSKCFRTCPDGSFLLNDLVTCQTCATQCVTCNVTASNCTLCLKAFIYNGRCVTSCPANFYNLNGACISCTNNQTACTLPPLSYKITPFYQNYKLAAYCVFNRPVKMNSTSVRDIIKVNLAGVSPSDYTYSINQYNQTTYLLNITTNNGVSLNENALSVSIDPFKVTDANGQQLSVSNSSASLPTGITSSVKQLQTGAKVGPTINAGFYALAALVILGALFKSYLTILVVEVAQIIYLHNFVNLSIGYLYNMIVGKVGFLDFTFLPNPLTDLLPVNYTTPKVPVVYQQTTPDMTFLRNAGCYLILLAILLGALIIAHLLMWQGLLPKVRKVAQQILIPRMRWSLIFQGVHFSIMPVTFFAIYQFIAIDLSGGWAYFNIILAALLLIAFLGYTAFLLYMGLKVAKRPRQAGPDYSFLVMEPTASLQLPLRLVRKILLAAFLVPSSYSLQTFGMASINIAWLVVLVYLQNSGLNKQRSTFAQQSLGWSYPEYIFNKLLIRCVDGSIIVYDILLVALSLSSTTPFIVAALVPLGIVGLWVIWRIWLLSRKALLTLAPSFKDDEERDYAFEGKQKLQAKQVAQEQGQEEDQFRRTGQSFNMLLPSSEVGPDPDDDDIVSIRSDDVAGMFGALVRQEDKPKKVQEQRPASRSLWHQVSDQDSPVRRRKRTGKEQVSGARVVERQDLDIQLQEMGR